MSLLHLSNDQNVILKLKKSVCKNKHDNNIFDAIINIKRTTSTIKESTPSLSIQRKIMINHIEKIVSNLMKGHNIGIIRFIIIRWFYTQKLFDTVEDDPLLPFNRDKNVGLWNELSKDGVSIDKIICIENLLQQMIQSFKVYIIDINNKNINVSVKFEDDMVALIHNNYKLFISKEMYKKLEKDYQSVANNYLDDISLFNMRLFNVVCRYQSLYAPGYHASIPKKVFDVLKKSLGVTHEIFSSPFNHSLDSYTSAYPDTDRFFGSKGNFFQIYEELFKNGGSFEANPPFLEEHMTMLALIVISVLSNSVPLSFVVIVPAWTDTLLYHIFTTSKYNVILNKFLYLNRHEHYYRNGSHYFEKGDEMRKSNNKSLVFILQNDLGKNKFPVTEDIINNIKENFTSL